MILKRALNAAAAVAAVAAAVGVSVVAAAFALYALAAIWLTTAGSAAVVAITFAVLALVASRLAVRRAAPSSAQATPVDAAGLMARATEMFRRRPLATGAAVAAALAALVIVWLRNPDWLARMLKKFTPGSAEPTEADAGTPTS